MELMNPDWLDISTDGRPVHGLNQLWYGAHWRRTAGCGPTAATTLLLYLNRRDNGILPYTCDTVAAATEAMEDVWRFVTPGVMGLNSTEKFVDGMEKLARHYGTLWKLHALTMTRNGSVADAAAFVAKGIAADCPVAFLNLHAGSVTAFDSWHWIVLTELHSLGDRHTVTALDGGRKIRFDLGEWVSTTKMGGGFVFLT